MIAALLLAAAPVAEANCGDLAQQPMNRCFAELAERVDAEMNLQWRLAAAAMKAADREMVGDPVLSNGQPGYFATLLAAQRAWLTYRDRHCLGVSFEARGGSLAPTLYGICKIDKTRKRIRELKELVGKDN